MDVLAYILSSLSLLWMSGGGNFSEVFSTRSWIAAVFILIAAFLLLRSRKELSSLKANSGSIMMGVGLAVAFTLISLLLTWFLKEHVSDIAEIKNRKGEIMPPNVTVARISGTDAGKNVLNMIAGRSMVKSNPKLDGILIALGGKYAAGDIFGLLTVKGRIAYEIKKYVFSSYRKPLLKLIKIGYNKLKRL